MSPLFPPWHFDRWEAVDDRVRGGSSTSHLEPVHLDGTASSSRQAARFWGHLDIDTLGGAGFASQSFTFEPKPLHLSRVDYKGLSLTLSPDHKLRFGRGTPPSSLTISLKTAPSGTSPPSGPRPARLTYEASVPIPLPAASGAVSAIQQNVGWASFKAFYRGREIMPGDERYKPLDTMAIYELSLMCRSDFGKQKGDFGVIVVDISGWTKTAREDEGDINADGDEHVGCWRWLGALFRRRRLLLPEDGEEKRLVE